MIGVDTSLAMLARAPSPPEGWKLPVADARALPLADACFDAATAAYLLHTLNPADRRAVLLELRRVLRPKGKLVVVSVAEPRALAVRVMTHVLAAMRDVSGVAARVRPWDPCPDLERCGYSARAHRRVGHGYPSLCVLATRR